MLRFVSYLVEDEPDQATFTREILEGHGFDVRAFSNSSAALAAIQASVDLIDLVVLDRRLPVTEGAVAVNAVGDELLDAVVNSRPDALIVVFTGHADIAHVQFTKRSRGAIELQGGATSFDKVEHFQKSESIEFEEYISKIESVLRSINNIEVVGLPNGTPSTKRLLRRVCHEYGGLSVTVEELFGGLTGAGVWRCAISDSTHVIADLVVKQTSTSLRAGGLQSILPASMVAGTVASIHGLCGGAHAAVLQVATSGQPVSLIDLLLSDPPKAREVRSELQSVLDSVVQPHKKVESLADIAFPYLSWAAVQSRLSRGGLECPDGRAFATSSWVPQHGDLHPGNVLVVASTPVLIDFDSEVTGSALIDAVALCLGGIFHKASPLRTTDWPDANHGAAFLSVDFLIDCPSPGYFDDCQRWINERAASDGEKWAVVLGFAARNWGYPDVKDHVRLNAFARSLCAFAAQRLGSL